MRMFFDLNGYARSVSVNKRYVIRSKRSILCTLLRSARPLHSITRHNYISIPHLTTILLTPLSHLYFTLLTLTKLTFLFFSYLSNSLIVATNYPLDNEIFNAVYPTFSCPVSMIVKLIIELSETCTCSTPLLSHIPTLWF